MRKSIYPVMLTEEERILAKGIVKAGRESARVIRRANMLLMMDENAEPRMKREDIAKLLGVNRSSVCDVSRQYCQEGLQATLTPKRQPTQHPPIKVDGVVQANIEQIACSKPPKGRSGWTLQLIADKLIELRIVDHICPESVRRALKKTNFIHLRRRVLFRWFLRRIPVQDGRCATYGLCYEIAICGSDV